MPIVEIECGRSSEKIIWLYFTDSRQNIFVEALKLKVDESGAKWRVWQICTGCSVVTSKGLSLDFLFSTKHSGW